MRLRLLLGVVGALAITASAPAILHFQATLDGLQETPPVATPATGFSDLFLNDAETQISVSLNFAGLLTPQTDAHIHVGAMGVAGPPVIPLPLGQFNNLVFDVTPEQVADLKAGLWYVNVHTQGFLGGEIRGQYLVPEPASMAALGAGALGFLARRRRKGAATPAI